MEVARLSGIHLDLVAGQRSRTMRHHSRDTGTQRRKRVLQLQQRMAVIRRPVRTSLFSNHVASAEQDTYALKAGGPFPQHLLRSTGQDCARGSLQCDRISSSASTPASMRLPTSYGHHERVRTPGSKRPLPKRLPITYAVTQQQVVCPDQITVGPHTIFLFLRGGIPPQRG